MNIKILGAASLFAATALSTPASAATTFTFASWVPWAHPMIKLVYVKWADAVVKASGGSIKIRRLPKGIGHPRAYLDAVRTGQIDIGFGVHGYSPKRFAAYQFAEFPLLSESAKVASVALWRTHEKFFAGKNFYKGVQLVGVNMHGPGQIHHRTKPILTPADMKGQKMRTGGPVPRYIIEAWGGVSVRQPATKSYEILSTGIADGIAFVWESVQSFKLITLLPYATELPGGIYNSSFYLVMSKKKYDSLPPKDKAVMAKFMGENFAKLAGEGWDIRNKQGRDAAVKAGTKIVTAPKAVVDSVKALTVKLEQKYVAEVKKMGIDGAAVLKFYRAEVAKLEAK